MKNFIGVAASLVFCLTLTSCYVNLISDIDNGGNQTGDTPILTANCKIGGTEGIDVSAYSGCRLMSVAGSQEIDTDELQIAVNNNECMQTLMVSDSDDRTYLMARTPAKERESVVLDVQSTTLALVMLHPVFSPLKADDYEEISRFIMASPLYDDLYREVERLVADRRDILDIDNDAMIGALTNLLDDLFKDVYDVGFQGEYDAELEVIPAETTDTRGNYDIPKIYPLSADIQGSLLYLMTTNLTPSYYGTVRRPNGAVENLFIPTSEDWGWVEWITQDIIRTGESVRFDFEEDGNYNFHLSRTNTEATIDFYFRLVSCIASTLGVRFDSNMINRIAILCYQQIGHLSTQNSLSVPAILNAVTGIICSYLSSEVSENVIKQNWWGNVRWFGSQLGRVLAIYNVVKCASNIIDRIAYAVSAPEEIDFCLCYYDWEVSPCTTARLIKAGGDNQTGYPWQQLMLPLRASVMTMGDDGLFHDSSSYHKVKFEVVSGGGGVSEELVGTDENNIAETYWYLGDSMDSQTVKAVIMDMITGEEISEEPIYYHATLSKADVTVKLSWNKHSGKTDIDLHVIDPFDEEICYYHMNSASGGFLDRDDVVGPGPEHIHWDNAPEGQYKILVHYYPNGDPDKSKVSYTIEVTAGGKTYAPKRGSLSYDETQKVGYFVIGDNQTRAIIESSDNSEIERIRQNTRQHRK